MTMNQSLSRKPKRRWLQFSLRTLLLFILGLSVACVWKFERVRRQREVVAWVLNSGGTVMYDYEHAASGFGIVRNPQPPSPKWLIELVGIDFFTDVVFVSLNNTEVRDVSMLTSLTSLKELHLKCTQVADLTPLAGLTNLGALDLRGTPVKDVTPLFGLTNLIFLGLRDTQVSQEDYKMLKKAFPNRVDTWSLNRPNYRPSVGTVARPR